MIQDKTQLRQNRVISDTVHVGIELELITTGLTECLIIHDDESCLEEYLRTHCSEKALIHRLQLNESQVKLFRRYFDFDTYRDDMIFNFRCDHQCEHYVKDNDLEDHERKILERTLFDLTNNMSIKVVDDASIVHDIDEISAEVCWNYHISKETLSDNEKILNNLKKRGVRFNSSCGLHINLNNYLKVPAPVKNVDTIELGFLFNLVDSTREESEYCNQYAISSNVKKSMIYHQRDRLEFRFFSPTLDVKKMNAYVSLAQHVYRRLAGIARPMPKRLEAFFRKEMKEVNRLNDRVIDDTIEKVNNIGSLSELIRNQEERVYSLAA